MTDFSLSKHKDQLIEENIHSCRLKNKLSLRKKKLELNLYTQKAQLEVEDLNQSREKLLITIKDNFLIQNITDKELFNESFQNNIEQILNKIDSTIIFQYNENKNCSSNNTHNNFNCFNDDNNTNNNTNSSSLSLFNLTNSNNLYLIGILYHKIIMLLSSFNVNEISVLFDSYIIRVLSTLKSLVFIFQQHKRSLYTILNIKNILLGYLFSNVSDLSDNSNINCNIDVINSSNILNKSFYLNNISRVLIELTEKEFFLSSFKFLLKEQFIYQDSVIRIEYIELLIKIINSNKVLSYNNIDIYSNNNLHNYINVLNYIKQEDSCFFNNLKQEFSKDMFNESLCFFIIALVNTILSIDYDLSFGYKVSVFNIYTHASFLPFTLYYVSSLWVWNCFII